MKRATGLVFTVVAALAMVGSQHSFLHAQAPRLGTDHKLEGGWDIVIWLPLGPNHEDIATPFRVLRTISSLGVVDGYGFPALTLTPGAINGTGHGEYKRIDNNRYSVTAKYFELNYGSPTPPFGSVVNSIQTVQETMMLAPDGNSYEGIFVVTCASPDGSVTGTITGRTKATRIAVQ